MPHTKVLVAQLSARKHYQEPILFHQWTILDQLYTDFYSGNIWLAKLLQNSEIYNYLPRSLKKGLDRYDTALKKARIIQFSRLVYQYTHSLKQASVQEVSRINIQIAKEFCRRIIKHGLGDANFFSKSSDY